MATIGTKSVTCIDLAIGDACVEQIEEVGEDLLGPDRVTTPTILSGMDEEPSGEAASAVTEVLDRLSAQQTRSGREVIGKATLEGLDTDFLVGTDDRAVGGRPEVEVDDGRILAAKLGSIGCFQ